jgi:hypothetical protein
VSTNLFSGPVFTQDHEGYVTTAPFSGAREVQPWEEPVEELHVRLIEPAPLRDAALEVRNAA